MQLQNVRILTDDTGAGVIELTACPNNLLVSLADLSAVVEIPPVG
jgi:hypothetical protein